ncbi:hypothetical protein [Phenylobacterium sp.]|uniref:hypothetical protein n=1 Tax=Phenylobacterium sp. TaxID=1871053 RepID=UPI002FCB64D1
MIKIIPLSVTKVDLDRAPEDHRVLFLLAGQFANDINLLRKQLIFANNGAGRDEFGNRTSMALAMLMVRLLVARMVAAWELLERKKYLDLLVQAITELSTDDDTRPYAEAASRAVPLLTAAFVAGGTLSLVRRKAAAHTDIANLKSAYAALPADYEMTDYLSEVVGNCLYGAADDLAVRVTLDFTGHDEPKVAISHLADSTIEASGAMEDLLQAWMTYFVIAHLNDRLNDATEKLFYVADAPRMGDVQTPFVLEASTDEDL